MTIFRHKNGRLYKLYRVSPPKVTGEFMESEDYFTGEKRRLNSSSWKEKDFKVVALV